MKYHFEKVFSKLSIATGMVPRTHKVLPEVTRLGYVINWISSNVMNLWVEYLEWLLCKMWLKIHGSYGNIKHLCVLEHFRAYMAFVPI